MKTLLVLALAFALPDETAIRKILLERLDKQHPEVGIVVGVVDGKTRESFGVNVDGDTVFEIGSITKVFTATLLADMVERGEVALDDPVSKYLPAEVKMPERNGRKITLRDLATHTSGLPRLPSNLQPKDPANPYADYTVAQLYAFLSSYELTRDPGSQYDYSNLGGGLLGHVLARRAGTDYETLVRKRILEPLGMKDTSIILTDSMKKRLAPGHDQTLRPVANWDLPTLAGAGALRSTARDLLIFLEATMRSKRTASMLASPHATSSPGVEIALGWHITTRNGRKIVWHNGGTGGYRSVIAFDPEQHVGVVALANVFTATGVDDIAMHLLDPAVPLAAAPKVRKEIALDPKLLQRLTGEYPLAPTFVLTVTTEGGKLFVQATGQPKFEVFAESEREFFYKVVDAQLTFELDENGVAKRVILHQNGREVPADRAH